MPSWSDLEIARRWRTLGAIPVHSGALQGSVIDPLLFLLFVNDIPDVLEVLTLMFEDDVKMVTRQSQNMNLHSLMFKFAIFGGLKRDIFTNKHKLSQF